MSISEKHHVQELVEIVDSYERLFWHTVSRMISAMFLSRIYYMLVYADKIGNQDYMLVRQKSYHGGQDR